MEHRGREAYMVSTHGMHPTFAMAEPAVLAPRHTAQPSAGRCEHYGLSVTSVTLNEYRGPVMLAGSLMTTTKGPER